MDQHHNELRLKYNVVYSSMGTHWVNITLDGLTIAPGGGGGGGGGGGTTRTHARTHTGLHIDNHINERQTNKQTNT